MPPLEHVSSHHHPSLALWAGLSMPAMTFLVESERSFDIGIQAASFGIQRRDIPPERGMATKEQARKGRPSNREFMFI